MKYDNIINFLSEYTIITTLNEFYKKKKIEFRCKLNHFNSLTSNSFSNKKCKIPVEDFCTNCKKNKKTEIQAKEFSEKIKNKSGHRVLSVDFSSRIVTYECFTCKKENKTFTGNLARSNGVCSKCQNDKNKLDFDYIKKEINVMGYESQAILWILKQTCDPLLYRVIEEDEIINDVVTDIVNFSYINNKKKHVYFPDFMIKETKIVIEVKSEYIFNKEYSKNKLKFQSVVNNGYILRLIMFDGKMNILDYICKTLEDIEKLFNLKK